MGGERGVDYVDFTLPLPPSINKIWVIIRKPGMPLDYQVSGEAKVWRQQVLPMIPKVKVTEECSMFKLTCHFTYNFFYKNGKVRRFDTQNLLKFLIDTVAQKQGFDDSIVKSGSWDSEHSDKSESVRCVLSRVAD